MDFELLFLKLGSLVDQSLNTTVSPETRRSAHRCAYLMKQVVRDLLESKHKAFDSYCLKMFLCNYNQLKSYPQYTNYGIDKAIDCIQLHKLLGSQDNV